MYLDKCRQLVPNVEALEQAYGEVFVYHIVIMQLHKLGNIMKTRERKSGNFHVKNTEMIN